MPLAKVHLTFYTAVLKRLAGAKKTLLERKGVLIYLSLQPTLLSIGAIELIQLLAVITYQDLGPRGYTHTCIPKP